MSFPHQVRGHVGGEKTDDVQAAMLRGVVLKRRKASSAVDAGYSRRLIACALGTMCESGRSMCMSI